MSRKFSASFQVYHLGRTLTLAMLLTAATLSGSCTSVLPRSVAQQEVVARGEPVAYDSRVVDGGAVVLLDLEGSEEICVSVPGLCSVSCLSQSGWYASTKPANASNVQNQTLEVHCCSKETAAVQLTFEFQGEPTTREGFVFAATKPTARFSFTVDVPVEPPSTKKVTTACTAK